MENVVKACGRGGVGCIYCAKGRNRTTVGNKQADKMDEPPRDAPVNYRVISGNMQNSQIFVYNEKEYSLDRKYVSVSASQTMHLRCRDRHCRARGKIVNYCFYPNFPNVHTCGTSSDDWLEKVVKARMKARAAREGTSLKVNLYRIIVDKI